MPEAHSSEQAAAGAVETRNALPTEQAEAEEEEDDIYGDIGGPLYLLSLLLAARKSESVFTSF